MRWSVLFTCSLVLLLVGCGDEPDGVERETRSHPPPTLRGMEHPAPEHAAEQVPSPGGAPLLRPEP